MKLKRSFFTQSTLKVAKELLGKYLVRKMNNGNGFDKLTKDKFLIGKIVETEAYIGPEDKASHAYGGKITSRNRAEWMIGGHIYIYLVYGMYWQLNISTGKEGSPECVLIRALEPKILNHESGIRNHGESKNRKNHNSRFIIHNSKIANGPGKLCRWMKFDKSFYGEDVTKSKRIWFTEGKKISKPQIVKGYRIGIDYAGPIWAKKPWRFWIKDNAFVSSRL